jgi:hypothetical protein
MEWAKYGLIPEEDDDDDIDTKEFRHPYPLPLHTFPVQLHVFNFYGISTIL